MPARRLLTVRALLMPTKGTTPAGGMRTQVAAWCQLLAAHVNEQVPGIVA